MKTLSLHAKLRNLQNTGVLTLKFNPDNMNLFSGEGRYHYQGHPVEVVPDVIGRGPQGTYFDEAHDVAWVPATGTLLASALSEVTPFEIMPANLRRLVRNFKSKPGK